MADGKKTTTNTLKTKAPSKALNDRQLHVYYITSPLEEGHLNTACTLNKSPHMSLQVVLDAAPDLLFV